MYMIIGYLNVQIGKQKNKKEIITVDCLLLIII